MNNKIISMDLTLNKDEQHLLNLITAGKFGTVKKFIESKKVKLGAMFCNRLVVCPTRADLFISLIKKTDPEKIKNEYLVLFIKYIGGFHQVHEFFQALLDKKYLENRPELIDMLLNAMNQLQIEMLQGI